LPVSSRQSSTPAIPSAADDRLKFAAAGGFTKPLPFFLFVILTFQKGAVTFDNLDG
jgi:hypothetical protein